MCSLIHSLCVGHIYFLFRENINIQAQGRALELAIAESIWAHYCVRIALEKKKIGDRIPLNKLFPQYILPPVLRTKGIVLKGKVDFVTNLIEKRFFLYCLWFALGIVQSKHKLPNPSITLPENVIILNGYGAYADLLVVVDGITWAFQARQSHLLRNVSYCIGVVNIFSLYLCHLGKQ